MKSISRANTLRARRTYAFADTMFRLVCTRRRQRLPRLLVAAGEPGLGYLDTVVNAITAAFPDIPQVSPLALLPAGRVAYTL